MEKIILVDCDGVLLNWSKGFEQHMVELGHRREPGTDDQYSLARRFGISEKTIMGIVKKFNKSKHVRELEPYKDSVRWVQRLHDEGFEFHVITSLSDDFNAKARRYENLQEVFGQGVFKLCNLTCLSTGADKQEVLEEAWGDDGYFWIEDHFRNAEAGYEVGLRPILIDTSYNRHYQTDLFPRVDEHRPWQEIYTTITDHYAKIK